MATRRALVHEADMRRWAKIAREEGVAVRCKIEPNGARTILIDPPGARKAAGDDDLDAAMGGFLGQ
jgi:hypothetical protein